MKSMSKRVQWRATTALLACCLAASGFAQDVEPVPTPPTTPAPAAGESERAGGDPAHIDFTLPFSDALAKARAQQRLLFVKPIYGGVSGEGARDYRCGTW